MQQTLAVSRTATVSLPGHSQRLRVHHARRNFPVSPQHRYCCGWSLDTAAVLRGVRMGPQAESCRGWLIDIVPPADSLDCTLIEKACARMEQALTTAS